MTVEFRQAREADIPALVALLADDPLGAGREGAPDDPAYARAFAAIAEAPGVDILVAEEAGRLVGCLQLVLVPGLSRRGATRAILEDVRAASDRRGEGIGRRLVAHALDRARAQGATHAQLASSLERRDAHRFWEAQGFARSHAGFTRAL